MPDLNTTLHVDMLRRFRAETVPLWQAAAWGYAPRHTLENAIAKGELSVEVGKNGVKALKVEELVSRYGTPATSELYGLHWGDPDTLEPLRFIKDRYLLPLISKAKVGVEIGPGGGRWTRYLARLERLYAVDYYAEVLEEFSKHFDRPNIIRIKNNGDDFPGIPDSEVDLLFSFATFVHLDLPIIQRYLAAMKRILKPGASVFIQYSDKTKIMGRENSGFSENAPDIMRTLVTSQGYTIKQEDTTTLWHSSIVIFENPA